MLNRALQITFLFFLFTSCNDKNNQVLERYREERTIFLQNLSQKEGAINFQISEELKLQFRLLSESQKTSLLNEEISLLKGTALTGPGPSGMAIIRDSLNQTKFKCGIVDYATVAVPKIFKLKELFYADVFPQTYYIPIRWYLINEAPTISRSSQNELKYQLDILNEAFGGINIQFFTYTAQWYSNTDWYKASVNSSEYLKMIDSLSHDPTTAINIFVTGQDDLLGSAIYPWDDGNKTNFDHILLKDTTFEGSIEDGNLMLGKTLIHEMGHFFGLFHTFHMEKYDANNKPINIDCENDSIHNGCGELTTVPRIGDGIKDTPPQKICHFNGCGKCEHGKSIEDCDACGDENNPDIKKCDTCPNLEGLDPIKNYMGYNPDYCMDHFTPEQYQVMKRNFIVYRRYLNSVPLDIDEPLAVIP